MWSVTKRERLYHSRLCISTHTLMWSVTCCRMPERDNYSYFNSHAHVERDVKEIQKKNIAIAFQLTRSRGAWRARLVHRQPPLNFNSHAHVERDTRSYLCIRIVSNFNSHAHVERDSITIEPFQDNDYFNSHAHVERDAYLSCNRRGKYISTHTLTWSVTTNILVPFPPRPYFNSHAHVERDRRSRQEVYQEIISTHTLTWSVTTRHGKDKQQWGFQLTRSRGAWQRISCWGNGNVQFQLTRSRGAWHELDSPDEWDKEISTHTLTWSVTLEHLMLSVCKKISTHTLTWSVTLDHGRICWPRFQFQLTRSRGAWRSWQGAERNEQNFNSHAHVERDKGYRVEVTATFNFNSHAHVERDTNWIVPTSGIKKFQLTRSRGAWRWSTWCSAFAKKFQLTRSRGAWP